MDGWMVGSVEKVGYMGVGGGRAALVIIFLSEAGSQ